MHQTVKLVQKMIIFLKLIKLKLVSHDLYLGLVPMRRARSASSTPAIPVFIR